MQGHPPVARMTYAEYVAHEEASPIKHEFVRGEVFVRGEPVGMAGGSPRHAALSGAVLSELRALARPRGCSVFSSDLRVRSEGTEFAGYPDVTVVCGDLRTAANDPQAVTNPKLVVEVLSPSSEAYDRGVKSAHYRHISSLEEIVLVSQEEELIEVHRKNERGRWELAVEARRGQRVEIASLGGDFAVDDVYEGVPAR